jgi:fatty acid desaturase
MISAAYRFWVFVLVSLVAFIAILYFVTRRRARRPYKAAVAGVAIVVVVGGMVFAKFGNNAGLPWWIYYTVPALVTFAVPPVVFKLSGKELAQYLVLALLSSPVIHVTFSFLFDWHEYMPFIPVPSLKSLLSPVAADI